MEFISKNVNETESIAAELAKKLVPPCTFCLSGDLGAGKTAFTRGLAKGYGYDDRVSSPTFTLMNIYEADVPVYHFDLYRLSDMDELYDLGFDPSEKSVTVVEWYENFKEYFEGSDTVYVTIERIDDNERKISLNGDRI